MDKNIKFYISIIIVFFILFFILNIGENYESIDLQHNIIRKMNTSNKYACIYAYYEKNKRYKNNFEYFLYNGGILDNIDYYIVINGTSTVKFPENDNINVIYRQNLGNDFGGFAHVIENYIKKEYDYLIFLNASVIGPYNISENSNNTWLDEFLKLFNKDVKLVGTTINIIDKSTYLILPNLYNKNHETLAHVQSMFFILDNEAFNYLKNLNFFDEKEINTYDYNNVVLKKEIGMSQLILKNNWNINCMLPLYRDIDYRKIDEDFNPSGINPYIRGNYFNNNITPEDVIFYKSYMIEEYAIIDYIYIMFVFIGVLIFLLYILFLDNRRFIPFKNKVSLLL